MQNDPLGEWTRLTRLYGQKRDEELLALAEEFGNLTEIAQGVLRDELRKRKLEEPRIANAKASQRQMKGVRFGEWSRTGEISDGSSTQRPAQRGEEESEKVYLCECEGSDQVRQLTAALQAAGIDASAEGIPFRPIAAFETARILVPADQLDRAREIASRPIPQEIIDELSKPAEDFEPPVCAKCGAEDPLLESVEPTNTWLCENCGARWSDAMTVENEGRNSA
jgi:hypothetical protein